MKKTILSALIPLFMATSAAFGTAVIAFNDNGAGGGTATSGSYASTSSFSFDVNMTLSGTTTSPGYSLWLEVPTALAPFITITNAQHFAFTIATDSEALPWSFNDTSGRTNSGFLTDKSATQTGDLGATGTTQSAGTFKVETITLQLTGAPAGTYTLQATTQSPKTSEVTDNNQFTDIPVTSTYSITVVPEPATLSLLGLGGLSSIGLTMLRARRKG